MRTSAALLASTLLMSLLASCSQYEYEEEVDLRVDGSGEFTIHATKDVFSSLHGVRRMDSDTEFLKELRTFYDSPVFEVVSVTRSRRNARTFFHIRARFDDLGELSKQAGLAIRALRIGRGEELSLKAHVEGKDKWKGVARLPDEALVAFRFHFPSPVRYHNSTSGLERGNIVRWETSVSELRRGVPLHLEARFDRRTVFSMTLILLAAAGALVILVISASLYFLTRLGRRQLAEQ